MSASVLGGPVGRFVDGLAPVLDDLAQASGVRLDGRGPASPLDVEAYNLVAAFIDCDGLHTDEELTEFLSVFAPRFDVLLAYSTPGQLRKAGLLVGKRSWLEGPSLLFDTLVRVDQRGGSDHARRYYQGAMGIAHAVCALDSYPSHTELDTVDRFRTMLLRTIELAGLTRPGSATDPSATAPAKGGATKVEPVRPVEELLAELEALVGLAEVKAEVRLVVNLFQVQRLRRTRHLPVADYSRHLVFTGNPGTGKTTVARIVGQLYRALDVVTRGQLVETDRAGLVAGYVGQTAGRVEGVVKSALGGVLLIDEAYSLARGSDEDFGREAIDTLVKLMEDHRDELVVIATGYPEEMQTFINANPGLRSRFPRTIFFDDYSDDQLVKIFESFCAESGYRLDPETRDGVRAWFGRQSRGRGFGNARLARNLFERSVGEQATRIVGLKEPTDDQICALLPDDIPA